MKFKKAFAVILAVAMVITLMPSMAFASTSNTVSGVSTVTKNQEFTRTIELEVSSNPQYWEGYDLGSDSALSENDVMTEQEINLSLDNAKWYYDGQSYSRLTSDIAAHVVSVDILDASGSAAGTSVDGLTPTITYCSPTSVTLKIVSDGNDALARDHVIALTLSLTSTSTTGDISVSLSSVSGDINTSTFTVATVVSGGTVANVPDDNTDDLATITIRNNKQTASDIVIRESSTRSVSGAQTLTLTLPKEVNWYTGDSDDAKRMNVANLEGLDTCENYSGSLLTGATSFEASVDPDNKRVLTIKFTPANSRTTRGTLTITPVVNTTKNASEGNLTVTLRGSDDISDASNLVIGKIGETNVSVYVDEDNYDEGEIPEIYSGVVYDPVDEDYMAIITVEETADGDLSVGKYIDFTFNEAVQLTGQVKYTLNGGSKADSNFENGNATYDKDRSTFGWEVTDATSDDKIDTELVFYIPYTVEAGFEGDIECTVTGSAAGVSETTVVVATAKPIVTVAATATDVRTGVQNQSINDITITESEAGALSDDVDNDYYPELAEDFYNDDYEVVDNNAFKAADLVVELPFELKEEPTATVTTGDLEIASNVVWSKNDAAVVGINIDASSVDTASTITLSNLVVSLSRTPAEGYYDTEVYGAAIVQNAGFGKDQAFADSYTIEDSINVVTPADSSTIATKIDALFTIGSASYTNNGTAVEMDAAPYIDSNNRTMVPIRYIAEACGVANDDITWNQATQTATINGANTVVSITMGSSIITTSSGNITMDTVAVNNNGRIYVPLRYIANALGANVIWDGTARTITLTN